MVEKKLEAATLAGGCFWCTEAIFKRLKGVEKVISGYSGGDMKNPTYKEVSSGRTGYAESIQIEFDPGVISYEKLLEVFWATHDPTTLNRQGSDVGTHYRSVIFYYNEEQRKKAEASKEKQEKLGRFGDKIVTEIVPFDKFYPAETYHQNYYQSHRHSNPYCTIVIDPKIKKLMKEFGDSVKEEYKSEKPKFEN
jgi:peptide-methionine (S)-S-oxide reductase